MGFKRTTFRATMMNRAAICCCNHYFTTMDIDWQKFAAQITSTFSTLKA